MPHAILLKSTGGLGIEQLADKLAEFFLCNAPLDNGSACKQCKSCGLLTAQTHPDYHKLTVAEDKSLLSVDQIRELVDQCMERPHQGGYRIAIVQPGDKINANAANALLKTLEEPGSDTLIILIADNNLQYPATILSRCQVFTLLSPKESDATQWILEEQSEASWNESEVKLALRMSNGAPIKALELLNNEQLSFRTLFLKDLNKISLGQIDPEKFVASIDKIQIPDILKWLYSLSLDSYKLSTNIDATMLINFDQTELLKRMSVLPANRLNPWIDRIVEARRLLTTTSNITPQLILEDLMFRWIAIFR